MIMNRIKSEGRGQMLIYSKIQRKMMEAREGGHRSNEKRMIKSKEIEKQYEDNQLSEDKSK